MGCIGSNFCFKGLCHNWDNVPSNALDLAESSKYYDQMQTGDLLLFSWPSSTRVKKVTNSPWTHIAMVYRNDGKINTEVDKLDPSSPGPLFLIEAIAGPSAEEIKSGVNTASERLSGVDLRQLQNKLFYWLKSYKGDVKKEPYVAWRQLKVERTEELLKSVDRIYEKYKNKKYEQNERVLDKAAMNCTDSCCTCCTCYCCCLDNKPDDSQLFCSELVAYFYMEMGILAKYENGGRAADEFVPGDFGANHKISLLNGAKLSETEVCFTFKGVDKKADQPSPSSLK